MSRIAEALAPELFDDDFRQAEKIVAAMPDGVPVDVCLLFEQLALVVRAAGFERYSARAILHRIRWHEAVEKGNREFRANNNWSAALARWFLAAHPELPNFFETRGDVDE